MAEVLSGIVLDEGKWIDLNGMCECCGISGELVREMIEEGLLAPRGENSREWIFCGTDVKRVQVALRLQQDLRVNLPGAALALELLEELQELRRMCRI